MEHLSESKTVTEIAAFNKIFSCKKRKRAKMNWQVVYLISESFNFHQLKSVSILFRVKLSKMNKYEEEMLANLRIFFTKKKNL